MNTQTTKKDEIITKNFQLYKGDCLIESDKIENDSIDLILTDLPYGNMKNAPSTWDKTKTEWDTTIDPEHIYKIADRVLKSRARIILFSQEPYTTQLISNTTNNIGFDYRAIWEKDNFANALGCRKSMVSFTEDILIFSKTVENNIGHPLQDYFYNEFIKSKISVKEYCNKLGTKNASHFFTKGSQFRMPNNESLKQLQKISGFFDLENEFKLHPDKQTKFLEYNSSGSVSTFNLWEGNKYKGNILKYKKDYSGHHPTQKPVLLLEDLIKTFSNEGNLILDLTMGSGSTGVACLNTNRNFIGIEKDGKYFETAKHRLTNIQQSLFK